jgi:hypothetical protein
MTEPATRDLSRIIEALEIAESEFLFHAARLANSVTPDTENEHEHLGDLQAGYEQSARYARILRRYQEGRIGRQEARGPTPDSTISKSGRSAAFTDE